MINPQFSLFPEEQRRKKDLGSLLGDIGRSLSEQSSQARYWGTLGRIACRRFPEMQRGEKVGREELLRMFKELKRHNGPVPSGYEAMNRDQLWGGLMDLRALFYRKMERYCPQTKKEIESANSRGIQEATLYGR